jgi:hypothetical protein
MNEADIIVAVLALLAVLGMNILHGIDRRRSR